MGELFHGCVLYYKVGMSNSGTNCIKADSFGEHVATVDFTYDVFPLEIHQFCWLLLWFKPS